MWPRAIRGKPLVLAQLICCHVADDVQGRLERLVLAREGAAAEELVALHLADHVLGAIPGALSCTVLKRSVACCSTTSTAVELHPCYHRCMAACIHEKPDAFGCYQGTFVTEVQ